MLTRRMVLRAAAAAAAAHALAACAPGRVGRKPVKTTMPFDRIAYGAAPEQFGELRRPAAGALAPVVVVLHGGFWRSRYDLGLMVPVCEALARDGFATWNVEYRRVGDPGGGWPGTFLDVGAAVDHLQSDRAPARPRPAPGRHARALGRRPARALVRGPALDPRWRAPRGQAAQAARCGVARGRSSTCAAPTTSASTGSGADGGITGAVPDALRTRRPDGADPARRCRRCWCTARADKVVPASLSVDYQREAKARGDDARLVEPAWRRTLRAHRPTHRGVGPDVRDGRARAARLTGQRRRAADRAGSVPCASPGARDERRRAARDEAAAARAALGSEVDDPVGLLHDVEVVLDGDARCCRGRPGGGAPRSGARRRRSGGRWSARRARRASGRVTPSRARRRA